MWGKHRRFSVSSMSRRSIPTRVGKTVRSAYEADNKVTVHPHACGENSVETRRSTLSSVHPHACGENAVIPPACGSSSVHPHACGENCRAYAGVRQVTVHPHACGENECRTACCRDVRSIPTRVGKTDSCGQISKAQVHPHACGENDKCWRYRRPVSGPSPRVWGKPKRGADASRVRSIPTRVGKTASVPARSLSIRSIPTRVGKTWSSMCRPSAIHAVHPHACGENVTVSIIACAPCAVHPHACGENAPVCRSLPSPSRSIPTRVGKTVRRFMRASGLGPSPRVWGKRHDQQRDTSGFIGPSPRVWGKRYCVRSGHPVYRSIPTRVGKTDRPSRTLCMQLGPSPRVWGKLSIAATPSSSASVHPHACGENALVSRDAASQARSIPTRVGKTDDI